MKELTSKEIDRYDELYEKAINRYLDKMDFDACEFLEPEESEELADLIRREQGE